MAKCVYIHQGKVYSEQEFYSKIRKDLIKEKQITPLTIEQAIEHFQKNKGQAETRLKKTKEASNTQKAPTRRRASNRLVGKVIDANVSQKEIENKIKENKEKHKKDCSDIL